VWGILEGNAGGHNMDVDEIVRALAHLQLKSSEQAFGPQFLRLLNLLTEAVVEQERRADWAAEEVGRLEQRINLLEAR
jgi:hypothetical protein